MALKSTSTKRRGKSVQPGFDIETLKRLADDLKTKRIPLDRMAITDDVQAGLRAIVRDTGAITFHAQYQAGAKRPYLKIGEYPAVTIEKARNRTRVIASLGARGIDVMEGLHDRLMREIDEKGEKWKP